MKLCTAPVLDDLCGEPAETSRCKEHPLPSAPKKRSREERGYNDAWRKLSQRARELQPWCSVCGTSEDLTADHLQWPATTLKHVDVLCRSHNSKKGAPTAENDPRGKTLAPSRTTPLGQAFRFTQFDNGSQLGGDSGGKGWR